MTIKTKRPQEVIRAFWAERIVIEEQARFLEPVYFFDIQREEDYDKTKN